MMSKFHMKMILAVGIGGFIGAILRYLLTLVIPLGTDAYKILIINVMGCVLLSVLYTYVKHKFNTSEIIVTGIGVGLIGAFTTFSTFSVETAEMVLAGAYSSALSYAFLSILGCISAVFITVHISDYILKGNGERK